MLVFGVNLKVILSGFLNEQKYFSESDHYDVLTVNVLFIYN